MMKDLSMHILDIVQNSIRAQAKDILITLSENPQGAFLISVEDNGCGMTKEVLSSVRNPFTTSRTTRKVGLGIPMLEQTCQMCNGSLEIESAPKKGTRLTARMEYNCIDRPPLGDMGEALFQLIITNPEIHFHYIHSYAHKEYILDTKEINDILDGVPMTDPEIMEWLSGNIKEGLAEIHQPGN